LQAARWNKNSLKSDAGAESDVRDLCYSGAGCAEFDMTETLEFVDHFPTKACGHFQTFRTEELMTK